MGGRLFMWESHVLHGFKPNIHPDRVTVAMNLIPTVVSNGDYGWRVNHLTPEERKISADKWAEGKLWDTPNVFPQDGLAKGCILDIGHTKHMKLWNALIKTAGGRLERVQF